MTLRSTVLRRKGRGSNKEKNGESRVMRGQRQGVGQEQIPRAIVRHCADSSRIRQSFRFGITTRFQELSRCVQYIRSYNIISVLLQNPEDSQCTSVFCSSELHPS